MKNLFTLLLLVFAIASINAQNEIDALRYSSIHFGGTARHNAMGGAFGALGGDLSSATINPAGIGVYRSSEFNFSTALLSNRGATSYLGNSFDVTKLNFNFNNVGYVGSIDVASSAAGWQRINIALGYNRIANFNNRYYVEGVNPTSSAIDQWVNTLNQNGGVDAFEINNSSEFYQGPNMAWQTYLIDLDTNATTTPYYSALKGYNQTQSYSVKEKGSIGESFLALGANYANKLYVGATVTTSKIRYNYEALYRESVADDDTSNYLQEFSVGEIINTEGRGYNAKIGLIYRPIDYLRLGASIQTPTFFSMSDNWSTDIESIFEDTTFYFADPEGNYDYILSTPFRATLSAAIQVGKLGLVSGDYEFINYSASRLQSLNGDYGFSTENSAIHSLYHRTGNLRLGSEWRIQQFRIRAGYSFYGNPLKSDLFPSKAYATYSAGVGFKGDGFYIDLAYNLSQKSGQFYLYDSASLESTVTSNNLHRITGTVGFRF